jgi:hypothetical protein
VTCREFTRLIVTNQNVTLRSTLMFVRQKIKVEVKILRHGPFKDFEKHSDMP